MTGVHCPCIRDCLCALLERLPNQSHGIFVSIRNLVRVARGLFLARLLDALLTGVHGALAAGLLGHLLASLLVWEVVSIPP